MAKKIKKDDFSSIDNPVSGISGFLKNKKNEIPMYDPHTGEPNTLYEELTGKKNPLLETAKMLNPNIRELKKSNRFLLHFPKEFGFDLWDIRSVSPISLIKVPKKILWFSYGHKTIFDNLIIVVNETIDRKNQILIDFFENKTNFEFNIEILDPTGVVVENIYFSDCYIDSLTFGALDYTNDNIKQLTLDIKFNKLNQTI